MTATENARPVYILNDINEVCRIFGGNKPISHSTLYLGIQQGRYPKPIKISANSSRWIHDEVIGAQRTIVETQLKNR